MRRTSKTLFSSVQDLIDEIGGILDLEPWITEELKIPKREIIKPFKVLMDDGKKETFTVYCVKYNEARGVYKGGIRAKAEDPKVLLETLRLLAADMTFKVAVANLPFGGAKTWLNVDPQDPRIKRNWEKIIKEMVRALDKEIGPEEYIPAPDVGTGFQEMAWILDAYQQLHPEFRGWGAVTGKPLILHGSEGREIATSRGGQFALRQALRDAKKYNVPFSGIERLKIVIQGLGKVGWHFAKLIQEDGALIIALSDSKGGILDPNGNGLDIQSIKRHKDSTGSVIDFREAVNISNEELLELGCDVLVPAAKENVITQENVSRIKAKVILELANAPLAPECDEILTKNGIFILPDILVNVGGVTVSYFEWVQNISGDQWRFPNIDEKLEYTMNASTVEVLETAREFKVTNRKAAYIIAMKRLAEALRLRGRYQLKTRSNK